VTGRFIVFEGIDGSGTTTQASRAYQALAAADVPIHLTQEPSKGPVGCLIRQVLTGRLVTPGRTGLRGPSWSTMGLLFAADRLDHLESEVEPNLEDGIHVVSDRYLHSSLVYQSATSGEDGALDWLATVNRFARRPDLVIHLDVDVRTAQQRLADRKMIREMYDDFEVQERLAQAYGALFESMGDESVVTIDGNADEETVHRDCMESLKRIGLP